MNQNQKLVLVDGNSLLNRAFYAMKVFSTKEGIPTNGIFGFVKLIIKIIETDKPQYFAVAFDVHAPTFRHKMYDGYKGTRKPMPEELVVQVPLLKELLAAMNIRCVELAGYEADDIIGTLSRRFENVDSYIYTGDRDAYQLVNEHVNVCFTKRGVTEIDLLTNENFYEKVGLTPAQIIEEKSLMGDSSDNIPGVKGIGPKTAIDLLQKYGDFEGIYAHLGELNGSLQKKLEEGKEMGQLSHTLATINTNVPIDVALESCRLTLPFPKAARDCLIKLEFRSMVDSDYFAKGTETETKTAYPAAEEFLHSLPAEGEFAFCMYGRECHIYLNGTENIFRIKENILDDGIFFDELVPILNVLMSEGHTAIVVDFKAIAHQFDALNLKFNCKIDDISILRYLVDSNMRALTVSDYVKDYGLSDKNCAYALKLAHDDVMKKIVGTAEEKLYYELEQPLSLVLLGMERYGVRVDTEKFSEFSEKYRAEIDTLSKRIFELAGVKSFNLNSPFQLSEILYEKLGLRPKGAKKNIRGGYSTSAEVLEQLAETHEIVRLILRFREVQKFRSTYIDGIRPLVQAGIVHTTYNQTMTATGRISSANPNLQNIPIRTEEGRELRKLFIARPGNVFVDADYSQIELRLLAHLSQCPALIDAYKRGEDIHAATAASVFGVSVGEVTPAMRHKAKSVNFGIIYGMSAFGLAKDINVSQAEAQSYINKYFQSYPEVKAYLDESVRFAKEHEYVTTILGRKRYVPELKSTNFNERAFGERAAMNMPLQGSAAEIIKIAMIAVDRRLRKEGLRARLVLQVHDELVIDTPTEETEQVKTLLREEMEGAMELSVPLIAEASVGKSWYEAK